jgi:hypothetical protein
MTKQDQPAHRFVLDKQPLMHELPELEYPYGMFGPNMEAVVFLGDILRTMERRRAAKKRAKDT